MLETNIRVVIGGSAIRLPVRYAKVDAAHLTSKELERVCNLLNSRHHLPARPVGGSENEVVVVSDKPLSQLKVEDDNMTLIVRDAGTDGLSVGLEDVQGKSLVPALLERALLSQVPALTSLWRLDSPRKWLERDPFETREGIEAYRRFEISSLYVEDVGVGFSVDVGTAFLASHTLDYFFAHGVSPDVSKQRQDIFERITSRQRGQKGTLAYRIGSTTTVCYFEKANHGQTCSRTPEFKLHGQTYRSLHDYYAQRHPDANVKPEEPAVLVSFRGLDQPVWVAARLLRVRVMNDSLPDSLASVDKIPPGDRVHMIENFWAFFEEAPFGRIPLKISKGFWRPEASRIISVPIPPLEFAEGKVLDPPSRSEVATLKQHYRERLQMLESGGVHHFPPTTNRVIHCAYPTAVPAEVASEFSGEIARVLSKWTNVPFKTNLSGYNSIMEATTRLRTTNQAGTVIFVLDEKPASYYDSAFQLAGWRLKRATQKSVLKHYKYLREGVWDRTKKEMSQRKGWQKWAQYVQMNALDVLQQMDGIPFRVPSVGEFEAQLGIDVGYDRRHVAISLLIAREKDAAPSFRIITEVHAKTDHKLETINPTILADMVLQIFGKVSRGKFTALRSLLVLRDGEFRGQERTALYQAFLRLKEKGFLSLDAITALGEVHKSSQKNIRLWERASEESITNPIEGSAVVISSNLAVLTTTGAATLHQGTAEPMTIVCEGTDGLLAKVVEATAAGAQLNWASPGVAQRLPLVFKRTDEELEIRYAQEIRRIA